MTNFPREKSSVANFPWEELSTEKDEFQEKFTQRGCFRYEMKNDQKVKSYSNESMLRRIFEVEFSARDFQR